MFDSKIGTKKGHIKYGFISKPDIALDDYFYRDRDYADKNRKIAANFIDQGLNDICVSKQVHGNECHQVDSFVEVVGDAMVTKAKKLPIAVQTADCVPVILYDTQNEVVAIAHAGWRGAFSGVIMNTIKKMLSIGADIKYVKAAIGPAISQSSYEVDEQFYQRFINQTKSNESFFRTSANIGKYMFDLTGYCKLSLQESGVENVADINIDTYKNTNDLFSYRRQCHLGVNKLDGHILSYVVIL